MQSADFWVELADASFGKVVLHGKNADRDTGEYYEVSSEINTDGDFAITFFKTSDYSHRQACGVLTAKFSL